MNEESIASKHSLALVEQNPKSQIGSPEHNKSLQIITKDEVADELPAFMKARIKMKE